MTLRALSSDATPYTKVNASIDLGSASLRAILLDEIGEWHQIINPNRSKKSKESSPHEWSILLKVTSDSSHSPIWQCHTDSFADQTVPAKIAVYFLVEDQVDTSRDDPYWNLNSLSEHHNKDGLRKNLQKGLLELLGAIKKEIASVCEKKRLELNRVILSIPVQWNEKFQNYYRDVIKVVFGIDEDARIEFVPEIQAVAHFTFDHRQDFPTGIPKGRRLEILIIDYGGHALSTCRFFVAYDPVKGKTCFFKTQEPKGALGGSEQWGFLLMNDFNEAAKKCPGRNGRDFLPEARLRIAQEIACQKCHGWGPLFDKPYKTSFIDEVTDTTQHEADKGGSSHVVMISAEQITCAFNNTFDGPTKLAREQIQALAQQEIEVLDANELVVEPKKHKKYTKEQVAEQAKDKGQDFALVMVSGSSSQNSCIQAIIEEACTKAKIRAAPIFIEDALRPEMSLKVARGAAIAVRDAITASDFIERGAAFGLQRGRKTKVNGQHEFNWDHSAALLISKEQKEVEIQFTSNGDPFRIVCQPFYGHHTGEMMDNKAAKRMAKITPVTYLTSHPDVAAFPALNVSETYDVSSLGEPLMKGKCDPLLEGQPEPLSKGQWQLKMTLDGNRIHFKAHRSPRNSTTFILIADFSTEMSTDIGSNCVFFSCNDEIGQGKTLGQRFHPKPEKNSNSTRSRSSLPPIEVSPSARSRASKKPKGAQKTLPVAQELQNSMEDDEPIIISDSEEPCVPSVDSQADSPVAEEIDAGSTLLYPPLDLQPPNDLGICPEATNGTHAHQWITIPEDHYPEQDDDQAEDAHYMWLDADEVLHDEGECEHIYRSPQETPSASFMHNPPQEDNDNTMQDSHDICSPSPSVSCQDTPLDRVAEAQMDSFPSAPSQSTAALYTNMAFQPTETSWVQTAQTQTGTQLHPERHPAPTSQTRPKPKSNCARRGSARSGSRGGGSIGHGAVRSSQPRTIPVPADQSVGSQRGEYLSS